MRGLRMQKVWLEFLHLHEPHPATSRAMGKKDGKAATTAPQVNGSGSSKLPHVSVVRKRQSISSIGYLTTSLLVSYETPSSFHGFGNSDGNTSVFVFLWEAW